MSTYLLYGPAVFLAECALSMLLNSNTLATLQVKMWPTLRTSMLTEICSKGSLAVVGRFTEFDIPIMIMGAVGAVVGDALTVYYRKRKRRAAPVRRRKRIPKDVTTA